MSPDEPRAEAVAKATAKLPKSPSVEIGTPGLRQYSGFIDEEFLRELRGYKAIETFREMEANSPVIGGCLLAIKQLLRRVQIFVEPFDDAPEHMERAEFVEQCLADMDQTWTQIQTEILTCLPFGWALLEQVYKKRSEGNSKHPDGKIGWKKWSLRSQETLYRWELGDHGEILGFWQQDPYAKLPTTLIPAEKFLLFRSETTKGNPEGRSVLRNAYQPYYFAKRTMEILGIGMERDLAGLPVIYAPQEVCAVTPSPANAAVKASLERVLRNLRRGQQEGVLMPNIRDDKGNRRYEFELTTSGGSRQFDVSKILEQFNRLQAIPLLADFILIGHEAVGSFALSSSKTELFATALAGWLEAILEVINEDALPRLFRMNGWPPGECPEVKHGDIETADLEKMGKFLTAYIGAGGLMDDDLDEHLRKQASWPILPEGLDAANEERTPEPLLMAPAQFDENGNPIPPAPPAVPPAKGPPGGKPPPGAKGPKEEPEDPDSKDAPGAVKKAAEVAPVTNINVHVEPGEAPVVNIEAPPAAPAPIIKAQITLPDPAVPQVTVEPHIEVHPPPPAPIEVKPEVTVKAPDVHVHPKGPTTRTRVRKVGYDDKDRPAIIRDTETEQ